MKDVASLKEYAANFITCENMEMEKPIDFPSDRAQLDPCDVCLMHALVEIRIHCCGGPRETECWSSSSYLRDHWSGWAQCCYPRLKERLEGSYFPSWMEDEISVDSDSFRDVTSADLDMFMASNSSHMKNVTRICCKFKIKDGIVLEPDCFNNAYGVETASSYVWALNVVNYYSPLPDMEFLLYY